jgi:dihydroneopterin aldolase
MTTPRIIVRALKARARLGCTAEERAYPQTVVIDLVLRLTPAATSSTVSDELSDTVDYMAVAAAVEATCQSGEWRLLEKMCRDIGVAVREVSPCVRSVDIAVRKNILPHADGVVCELTVE